MTVEDDVIVYDAERDVVHGLNPTAALILLLCDGLHDVEEIKAAVSIARDNGSPSASDTAEVDAWLTQAEAEGLISRNGLATLAPPELNAKELATLAERLHSDGNTGQAFRCQRRATELDPRDSTLWYTLGELAHEQGERTAARDAYRHYLELEPDNAEVAHLVIALSDAPPPERASDACIVQTFGSFAETFNETMLEDLGYRAPELLKESLGSYLPVPQSDLRVADLGCGTGLAAKHFKPWARHMVGVDLSPEMTSHACATGLYDEIHIAELVKWLLRVSDPFDLMVACDLLIYFGDLTELLAAAARALVSDGKLGITSECLDEPGYRITYSGRYAHSYDYIQTVAADAGLKAIHKSEAVIRSEYSKPVKGIIVVLEKQITQTAREARSV